VLFPAVRVASTYYADGGIRLNTPLAPALRLGADRVLVVALRQSPRLANEAALADQRVENYASPLFLFGKVLNALLLDHLDTDLARMNFLNEILEDGEKAYGAGFQDKLNEVSGREGDLKLRKIHSVVVRPSADLGLLAGQILANLSESKTRSPLLRLAARNLTAGGRSTEADLLSYLLFDGEFLGPLAELGFADARAREDELCEFFSDAPAGA
jgi:NTE family protein